MKTLLYCFVCSLLFVPIFSPVHSIEIGFTEHTIAENLDQTMSVYAKDIDSDGDVDIIGCAYGSNLVAWWENDGNQHFTMHLLSDQFDGARTIYAFDVDSDNDVDILGAGAANNNSSIAWWENDGNQNFTEHTISTTFNGAHTVYATDIDRDNDVDILGSAWSVHGISWWENDGNENFTEHVIDQNGDRYPCVYATDMDGDEDIDVLGCIWGNNQIAWWENDGNQNFTEHVVSSNFTFVHWIYAIDVDGDGDEDILGAAYGANEVAWWENDGDENFTQNTITNNFLAPTSVYAEDLDMDGDFDVLSAAETASAIRWWENDGNGNFTEYTLTSNFSGASHAHAEDIDGDGDMDVVGAARFGQEITWWESDLIGAHFMADPTTGHAPLTVQYTGLSFTMEPVTSWTWDFNSDGTFDAQDQNPSWIYNDPGTYTVSFNISTESNTYSTSYENYIRVFDGESALQFDGVNSSVLCHATPSMNLIDALTIEAWINPTGWGEMPSLGFGRIIDKQQFSLFLINSHSAYNDHSIALQLFHSDNSNSFSSTPEHSIDLDNWQHIAVTYDGATSEVRMYINGVAQQLTQAPLPSGHIANNSTNNFIIGNDANGTFTFDGIIDEVRLWNRVRTEEDIQTNRNSYLVDDEPGLVGYWQMNEGNGETTEDHSDHGHEGRVEDAAWIQGFRLTPASVDDDEDGIVNSEDNCPNDYNPEQEDTDADGIGNACDNCPDVSNTHQTDADGDDVGDACDSCTDTDDDGYGNPGFPANTCAEDNCPAVYNPDQVDAETGDVDCQGGLDVLDVLAVVNHILGISPLIGSPLQRGDCNGDGGVDILDALGIINVILGIGECSPAGVKPVVTSEVLHFCESLEHYLSPAEFNQFMALVKEEAQVPSTFSLSQNYPNPFNPTTEISFAIPVSTKITLEIYNLLGQVVHVLLDTEMRAGYHVIQWDASDTASGIYFYRLKAGHFTAIKKMVLIQ